MAAALKDPWFWTVDDFSKWSRLRPDEALWKTLVEHKCNGDVLLNGGCDFSFAKNYLDITDPCEALRLADRVRELRKISLQYSIRHPSTAAHIHEQATLITPLEVSDDVEEVDQESRWRLLASSESLIKGGFRGKVFDVLASRPEMAVHITPVTDQVKEGEISAEQRDTSVPSPDAQGLDVPEEPDQVDDKGEVGSIMSPWVDHTKSQPRVATLRNCPAASIDVVDIFTTEADVPERDNYFCAANRRKCRGPLDVKSVFVQRAAKRAFMQEFVSLSPRKKRRTTVWPLYRRPEQTLRLEVCGDNPPILAWAENSVKEQSTPHEDEQPMLSDWFQKIDWDKRFERYGDMSEGEELPPFGESGSEAMYSSDVMDEIDREQYERVVAAEDEKMKPLDSADVETILIEIRANYEKQWTLNKLPRLERKSFDLWNRFHGRLPSSAQKSQRERLARESRDTVTRFEAMITQITSLEYRSRKLVEYQAESMRETVYQMREQQFLSELYAPKAPCPPPDRHAPPTATAEDSDEAFEKFLETGAEYVGENQAFGVADEDRDGDDLDDMHSDSDASRWTYEDPTQPVLAIDDESQDENFYLSADSLDESEASSEAGSVISESKRSSRAASAISEISVGVVDMVSEDEDGIDARRRRRLRSSYQMEVDTDDFGATSQHSRISISSSPSDHTAENVVISLSSPMAVSSEATPIPGVSKDGEASGSGRKQELSGSEDIVATEGVAESNTDIESEEDRQGTRKLVFVPAESEDREMAEANVCSDSNEKELIHEGERPKSGHLRSDKERNTVSAWSKTNLSESREAEANSGDFMDRIFFQKTANDLESELAENEPAQSTEEDSSEDEAVSDVDEDDLDDAQSGHKKSQRPTAVAARQKQQRQQRRQIDQRAQERDDSQSEAIAINPGDTGDKILIDPWLSRHLKEHQLEGIRFMWRETIMMTDGSGCLLAHTMGLGKTLQVITYLDTLGRTIVRDPQALPEDIRSRHALILCPSSLVQNWTVELQTWTPDNEMGKLFEPGYSKHSIDRLETLRDWSDNGGILILSYTLFRLLLNNGSANQLMYDESEMAIEVAAILREEPTVVIADEAHTFKNDNTGIARAVNSVECRKRIALTGSPLSNNLMEYWAIMNWLEQDFLGTKTEFRSKHMRPIEAGNAHDATKADRQRGQKQLKILLAIIGDKIDRRNVDCLRTLLPSKFEYVLFLGFTPLQKQIYNSLLEVARISKISSMYMMLLLMAHLKLICNHPTLINPKYAGKNQGRKGMRKGHNLDVDEVESESETAQGPHNVAIELWRSTTLAKYKTELKKSANSAKVTVLLSICKSAKSCGDKVLIFSFSIPTVNYLRKLLNKHSLGPVRELTGQSAIKSRVKDVAAFNEMDGYAVCLISCKAGGQGLNMVGANRVVIFDHDFNPMWTEQAIGRAYRMGQKKDVYVYRLQVDGSYESKMFQQSLEKIGLTSKVVDKKNVQANLKKQVKLLQFFRPAPETDRIPDIIEPFEDQILAEVLKECPGQILSVEMSESFHIEEGNELNATDLIDIQVAQEAYRRGLAEKKKQVEVPASSTQPPSMGQATWTTPQLIQLAESPLQRMKQRPGAGPQTTDSFLPSLVGVPLTDNPVARTPVIATSGSNNRTIETPVTPHRLAQTVTPVEPVQETSPRTTTFKPARPVHRGRPYHGSPTDGFHFGPPAAATTAPSSVSGTTQKSIDINEQIALAKDAAINSGRRTIPAQLQADTSTVSTPKSVTVASRRIPDREQVATSGDVAKNPPLPMVQNRRLTDTSSAASTPATNGAPATQKQREQVVASGDVTKNSPLPMDQNRRPTDTSSAASTPATIGAPATQKQREQVAASGNVAKNSPLPKDQNRLPTDTSSAASTPATNGAPAIQKQEKKTSEKTIVLNAQAAIASNAATVTPQHQTSHKIKIKTGTSSAAKPSIVASPSIMKSANRSTPDRRKSSAITTASFPAINYEECATCDAQILSVIDQNSSSPQSSATQRYCRDCSKRLATSSS